MYRNFIKSCNKPFEWKVYLIAIIIDSYIYSQSYLQYFSYSVFNCIARLHKIPVQVDAYCSHITTTRKCFYDFLV